MSLQEKENILNIFSALLISIVYGLIVYQRHLQGRFDLTEDFKTWGIVFLIFIGISIVARIIIYIVFYIINTIVTKEEEKHVKDEREKLIKLKSARNGNHAFSLGMVGAFIALAIGMPVYGILIAFVGSCVLSEIIDNTSQIYYNRKGV